MSLKHAGTLTKENLSSHPVLMFLSCVSGFLSFSSRLLFFFRLINNNYFYGAIVDPALSPADATTNWKISDNCVAFYASFATDLGDAPRRSECPSFCQTDSGVPSYDRAVCGK